MPPDTSSPASSSSSCVSFGSFDEVSATAVKPPGPAVTAGGIKFLCSYGGKILPRRHDGRLRYVGGHTRVVSVQRSIRFYDLRWKLRELCGWDAATVRFQLPTEDMDALVTVTSDDDLSILLEEYDLAEGKQGRPQQQLRVRAFLYPSAGTARTPRAPSTPPLDSRRRTPRPVPACPHHSCCVALHPGPVVVARAGRLSDQKHCRFVRPCKVVASRILGSSSVSSTTALSSAHSIMRPIVITGAAGG